jgi:hypothetical protein
MTARRLILLVEDEDEEEITSKCNKILSANNHEQVTERSCHHSKDFFGFPTAAFSVTNRQHFAARSAYLAVVHANRFCAAQ